MRRYALISQFSISRFWHIALLIMLVLNTTACTFKIFYNQLDWLIPSYIEEYVTLDPTQQTELDRRLRAALRWHRQTQLPAYTAWLQTVRNSITNDTMPRMIEHHMRDAEKHWALLLARLAPELAEMLATLTKKQHEEMFTKFAEQNSELLEKIQQKTLKQRRDELLITLQENFRRRLGSLTAEQKKLLADSASALEPVDAERLQTRLRWQHYLRDLLENHHDAEYFRPLLQNLLQHPEMLRDQGYRDKLAHNRERIKEMILLMLANMTAAQKQYLLDDLDEWSNNLQELVIQEKTSTQLTDN